MSGQPHAPTELTSEKLFPTNTISIERLTDPRHDTEQTAEIKMSIYTGCTTPKVHGIACHYTN